MGTAGFPPVPRRPRFAAGPPVPPTPAPPVMTAARPDAPRSSSRERFAAGCGLAADDGGVASYEVGAGVGDDGPARRPFLRATLAGEPGDDSAGGADAPREVVVRDRFARLDAGLPPLPPPAGGGRWGDEDLSPTPASGRTAAAYVAAASFPAIPPRPAPVAVAEPLPAVERVEEGSAPAPNVTAPPAADPPVFAPMVPPGEPAAVAAAAPGPVAQSVVAAASSRRPAAQPSDAGSAARGASGRRLEAAATGEPAAVEPAPAEAARRSIFRAFSG